MVPNAGAPVRADPLRPLNLPRPLTVTARDNRPLMLHLPNRQLPVTQIRDVWRIDDEWWRAPISRGYYRLVLADGICRTIYRDLLSGDWYAHAY